MDKNEVLSNLCYYDTRNPNNIIDEDEAEDRSNMECFCDNCFYGRTKMALYILTLIE